MAPGVLWKDLERLLMGAWKAELTAPRGHWTIKYL
jgi:hypothetical protein